MNKKFTKKELERLNCSEDEIKLIVEYQKKLPVIIENDEIEGFCVDARTLHEQLGVGKHFANWFSIRMKAYQFTQNVDFIMITPNGVTKQFAVGGDTRSKEYLLTIDMTKQLCMIERTEIGRLARRYFITMESIVARNKDWWTIRNPEKKEYNEMCEALSQYLNRTRNRDADKYDYSREANILNIIATGSSAQSIRNYFSLDSQSELTRDSLEKDYNEKLAFLQKQNILLLGMNMGVLERTKWLIQAFDVKYTEAKPILNWLDRTDMLKARDMLLVELEK